jgi:hypothetical protein
VYQNLFEHSQDIFSFLAGKSWLVLDLQFMATVSELDSSLNLLQKLLPGRSTTSGLGSGEDSDSVGVLPSCQRLCDYVTVG